MRKSTKRGSGRFKYIYNNAFMCKQLLLLSFPYYASVICCSENSMIFTFSYVPKRRGEEVCNEAELCFRKET